MRLLPTSRAGTSFLVGKIAYPVPARRSTLVQFWPLGHPHAGSRREAECDLSKSSVFLFFSKEREKG